MSNQIVDQGCLELLKTYFQGQALPAQFYVRLAASDPALITDTSVLADITEVAGTGYAAQTLQHNSTDFPTVALQGGVPAVDSKQVVFAADGAWTQYRYVYLATTSDNTGKLIAVMSVTTARALAAGESYRPTVRLTVD